MYNEKTSLKMNIFTKTYVRTTRKQNASKRGVYRQRMDI